MKLDNLKELKEKGEILPATYDSIFKSIIQDEKLKDFTAFLISSINKRIIDKADIVFVNTEGTKNTILDRVNVSDIIIDINYNRIELEMNKNNSIALRKRNTVHYHEGESKIINVSYRLGEDKYFDQICFDNFKTKDRLISVYKVTDLEDGKEDEDEKNFTKYRINMVKVYNKYYNELESLTRFEKAIGVLSFNKISDLRNISRGDEMLMRVVKKLEELTDNPDMVEIIDADKAMEYGHKLDIEEAKKNKSIETAKRLLEMDMPLEDISKVTDLSKEEIEKLK